MHLIDLKDTLLMTTWKYPICGNGSFDHTEKRYAGPEVVHFFPIGQHCLVLFRSAKCWGNMGLNQQCCNHLI